MKLQIDAVSVFIQDLTRQGSKLHVIKEPFYIEEKDLDNLPNLIREQIKAWKQKNGIDSSP